MPTVPPTPGASRNRIGVFLVAAAFILAGLLNPSRAGAWGHQGHILITRLACLGIIDDPKSPPELVAFLRANMPSSIDDCRQLALHDTIGLDPPEKYLHGLDGWCTWPDRIRGTPQGSQIVPPYGVADGVLHYVDLEVFSASPTFRDDLSHKPRPGDIPRDISDPRWKLAGLVPFRVEECFDRLTQALANPADADEAARWAGLLAHYSEDSTQPHHTTVDYRSIYYLAGRVPGVPAAASQPANAAIVAPRVASSINPHGDMEFELFVNDTTREPYRQQYWTSLTRDLAAAATQPITPDSLEAAVPPARTQPAPDPSRSALTTPLDPFADVLTLPATARRIDPFAVDIDVVLDSYDYLPLIGHAAQAAYATGTFNPDAFFPFTGPIHGRTLSIVQLIALQNAKAVVELEAYYRAAWAESRQIPATQPSGPG